MDIQKYKLSHYLWVIDESYGGFIRVWIIPPLFGSMWNNKNKYLGENAKLGNTFWVKSKGIENHTERNMWKNSK